MSETSETAIRRTGPMRVLYDWVMRHATGPYAFWFLGAIAFAESSFFPIPPDVMLVPMALANRRRAFHLAAWCMLCSVVGGMLGYAIGAWLYDTVGHWLIDVYGYSDQIQHFRDLYREYGAWIILIKGMTPIPYKLVTIASGIAGYNFPLFVLLSAITRGARFFMLAALIYWFGEPVREFIEKRLELVMLAFLVALVGGFVLFRYAF